MDVSPLASPAVSIPPLESSSSVVKVYLTLTNPYYPLRRSKSFMKATSCSQPSTGMAL